MLFSIIIPTYNRSAILPAAINSVLSQTFGGLELIVVDDGSTDDTKKTVEQFNDPRLRYFYKTNEERSIARNFGAQKAEGDYLIFLDSDDRMMPAHLELISEHLKKNNREAEFIFTGYSILNKDGSLHYAYSASGTFNREALAYGNYLGCSAVVIKRELFLQYRFNTAPELILFEDWELWLRVIASHPLECIPSKTILMINHDERSVLSGDDHELIRKISFLARLVTENIPFIKTSRELRRRFLSGIYSYASLHIALRKKNRGLAFKYLVKSLRAQPLFIFRRRFAAIIKHLA